MINIILTVLFPLTYLMYLSLFTKIALHMFQQNRYEIKRFRAWQKNNVTKTYPLNIMVSYLLILIISLFFKTPQHLFLIGIVIFIVQYLNQLNSTNKSSKIKPLVISNRVKRQILTYSLLAIIMLYCALILNKNYYIMLLIIFIYHLYTMHIISIVSLINEPLEKHFKKVFLSNAKAKLKSNTNLIKIGITGSYGKTSSKNIINEIISKQKYTLVSPASYNTPLGLAMNINNDLKPIHEVYIAEMGADKKGDISELMTFINPQIGIVTSIGEQHLQT
ncbi:MAG: Mur ligase family protein, partial [Bacilli bacterium]